MVTKDIDQENSLKGNVQEKLKGGLRTTDN
jgi:hypothetical protein